MNKLTPPPAKRKQPTEADIDAMISRGGAVAENAIVEPDDDESIVSISTRLTRRVVRQIDVLRASRPRKMASPKMGVSLRDWIVEAIVEKLERDKLG